MRVLVTVIAIASLFIGQVSAEEAKCEANKNNTRFVSYFSSKPQDSTQCAMSVKDGKVTVSSAVSNPAMSCPDMFAWKLFVETIQERFWDKWAADQHLFAGVHCPNGDKDCKESEPLPLCASAAAGAPCCDPASAANPGYDDARYPAKLCPFFPGDHRVSGQPAELRLGTPPSKAHTSFFTARAEARKILYADAEPAAPIPGRKIKQSVAELVFRNKPVFDYVFKNNLYNQEGLIDVFRANNRNIGTRRSTGAPYRLSPSGKALSEIELPVESVMIKTDWLSKRRADEMGVKDDPGHPYVKMNILTPSIDNNGTILEPGEHWLVAMHISSKDIPNWVWATFEHVNNPGRCDYTGCNDSYGYTSPDAVSPDLGRNYTRPNTKCDALPLPSWTFQEGGRYGGGEMGGGLKGVFDALSMGTADNGSMSPEPADKAWASYRLKGSQVNFTDSMGRPTILGSSVIEGGFVGSSSCMTCHARAATGSTGSVPAPLSVFLNEITESGYLPGARGLPIPDWYHRSGQPPDLQALQTDFVWGFVRANCIRKDC